MLFHIFLYHLLAFTYVDGKDDQAFIAELFIQPLDERPFMLAIDAPRRPKLQQHHFPFDGGIVELLAGGSGGVETGSRFFDFTATTILSEEATGEDRDAESDQQRYQFRAEPGSGYTRCPNHAQKCNPAACVWQTKTLTPLCD